MLQIFILAKSYRYILTECRILLGFIFMLLPLSLSQLKYQLVLWRNKCFLYKWLLFKALETCRNQIQTVYCSAERSYDAVTGLRSGWLATHSTVWVSQIKFYVAFWCRSDWTTVSRAWATSCWRWFQNPVSYLCMHCESGTWEVDRRTAGKIKCIKTHLDTILL